MRRTLGILIIALAVGASGTALAASPSAISSLARLDHRRRRRAGARRSGALERAQRSRVERHLLSASAIVGRYGRAHSGGAPSPRGGRPSSSRSPRSARPRARPGRRRLCPSRELDTCCSSSSATSSRSRTSIRSPRRPTGSTRWVASSTRDRGQPRPGQATTVSRRTSGSVKTSRSSRLVEENSEITAPSGPAVKECRVSGGIVNCSPGRRTSSRPSTHRVDEPAAAAKRLLLAGRARRTADAGARGTSGPGRGRAPWRSSGRC